MKKKNFGAETHLLKAFNLWCRDPPYKSDQISSFLLWYCETKCVTITGKRGVSLGRKSMFRVFLYGYTLGQSVGVYSFCFLTFLFFTSNLCLHLSSSTATITSAVGGVKFELLSVPSSRFLHMILFSYLSLKLIILLSVDSLPFTRLLGLDRKLSD